jgi:hypothetical protein
MSHCTADPACCFVFAVFSQSFIQWVSEEWISEACTYSHFAYGITRGVRVVTTPKSQWSCIYSVNTTFRAAVDSTRADTY